MMVEMLEYIQKMYKSLYQHQQQSIHSPNQKTLYQSRNGTEIPLKSNSYHLINIDIILVKIIINATHWTIPDVDTNTYDSPATASILPELDDAIDVQG